MLSHAERVTALRTILATAEGIKKLLPLGPPPAIPRTPVLIPPLSLLIPEDVTNALDLMKNSHQVFKEAALKIFDSINEVRMLHIKNYQQVCQKLSNWPSEETFNKPFPHIFNDLRRAFESSYSSHYIPWFRKQIHSVNAALTRLPRQRSAFKNEYTPLLEDFFLKNPYPSSSERLILAEQTKMTPRQIEVWFQNHRNRSNRPLKRAGSNTHARQMQGVWQKQSVDQICSSLPDKAASQSTQSNPLDSPFYTSPPYAFPSRYPPNCNEDPFPTIGGRFVFPQPVWRRIRTTSTKAPPVSHNFDEFVSAFATKLTIRDGLSIKKCGRTSSAQHKPWYTATHTRPSPAPHPALIRRTLAPTLSSLPSPMSRFGQTSLRCIPSHKSPPFVKRAPRISCVEPSLTWSCQGGSSFRAPSCSSVSSVSSSLSDSECVNTPPSSPISLPEISDPFDNSDFFDAFNFPSYDFTPLHFPMSHVSSACSALFYSAPFQIGHVS